MLPFYRPAYNYQELCALICQGSPQRLAQQVAAKANMAYGLPLAYARMALVTTMQALNIPPGEIILPAYTCVVMAHAVMAAGHRPVFVDIDLHDYNVNLNALKQALTPQTRAVVATHMYGYPCNVQAIRHLLGDETILIIEDAALGVHTLCPNQPGIQGDIGLFSFGFNKPLSSVEGGILVTNSVTIYEQVKNYQATHTYPLPLSVKSKRLARFLASYILFQPRFYKYWYQRVVKNRPEMQGHPAPELTVPADHLPRYCDTAYPHFQAKIGLIQLAKLEQTIARRRQIAQFYQTALQDVPHITLPPLKEDATYAYYTIRLPQRDVLNFRARMAAQGIGVDQTYDYALPALKNYQSFTTRNYPHTQQAADEVVNLPCYPHLSVEQAKNVVQAVRVCLQDRL